MAQALEIAWEIWRPQRLMTRDPAAEASCYG